MGSQSAVASFIVGANPLASVRKRRGYRWESGGFAIAFCQHHGGCSCKMLPICLQTEDCLELWQARADPRSSVSVGRLQNGTTMQSSSNLRQATPQ